MAFTQGSHHGFPLLIGPLLVSAFLLPSVQLAVSYAAVSSAVTADGTLGTRVTQSGKAFTISGGTIAGSNQFHSFGRFSVGTGDRATFTGPPAIANTVSRVTGGQQSVIDGMLRSEITGANLYLLNPSGVLFGPNAALEVSGSFHVSTADFLRFADSAKFFANPGQEGVLTVASPAAFGFLGQTPAPITIQGSSLQVPSGKAVSVVGGDVRIADSLLRAPSGRIQLASVASPGEVIFTPLELAPDLQVDSFARLGRMELQGSNVTVSSNQGAGTVLIRGGRLLVDNAFINANTFGAGNSARLGIDLRVTEDAVFTNAAQMLANSSGAGHAGDVRITAGSLQVKDDAFIVSAALSTGNGGNVTVNTGRLEVLDGGTVNANTEGSGRGGSLEVTADNVILSGANATECCTGLFASQLSRSGTGNAGNLQLTASSLQILDGAEISTGTFGPGQGGNLEVMADRVFMSGSSNPDIVTGIFANTFGTGRGGTLRLTSEILEMTKRASIQAGTLGPGDAGSATVRTGRLELRDGSGIFTTAIFGSGNAGNLDVTADTIFISGVRDSSDPFGVDSTGLSTATGLNGKKGGNLRVTANNVQVTNKGSITSSSLGAGDAGKIEMNVGSLLVTDGSTIVSSAFGSGHGGDIQVQADRVTLAGAGRFLGPMDAGFSAIASQAGLRGGTAGDVRITAGSLQVLDGARITTQTFGPGRGGELTVVATDRIDISGRNPEGFSSGLFSSTSGRGLGGNLRLAAPHIQLRDGGTISASSTGDGAAGTLRIQAGETFRSHGGRVTTSAARAGGGRIELHAGSLIQLIESELTTAVEGGGSDAGNIFLDSPFVVFDQSLISANAFAGRGGNISIEAGVFLADPASRVTASSTLGISGLVDIRAPVTNLVGTLAPLPQTFVSVAELLPARCAVHLSGDRASSLVLGGRDGLPSEPGDLLSSPLLLEAEVATEPASRFALLERAAQRLPRLQGGRLAGFSPAALDWRCGE